MVDNSIGRRAEPVGSTIEPKVDRSLPIAVSLFGDTQERVGFTVVGDLRHAAVFAILFLLQVALDQAQVVDLIDDRRSASNAELVDFVRFLGAFACVVDKVDMDALFSGNVGEVLHKQLLPVVVIFARADLHEVVDEDVFDLIGLDRVKDGTQDIFRSDCALLIEEIKGSTGPTCPSFEAIGIGDCAISLSSHTNHRTSGRHFKAHDENLVSFGHELLSHLACKKALALAVDAAPHGNFTRSEIQFSVRPLERMTFEFALEDLATFLNKPQGGSNGLREVARLPFGRKVELTRGFVHFHSPVQKC